MKPTTFELCVVSLLLCVGTTSAQAQVGRGVNGGVCFGAYCEPGQPDNGGGKNAYGGICLGAYCDPPAGSEQSPSQYVPYPTASPYDPAPDEPAPSYQPNPNPFSSPNDDNN